MKRIYSLDVLRGVAIMIMVFVDAPPGVAYPIFVHAPWEGLTFADFAFPGFVFAMGLSAAVSTAKRKPSTKKILKRAAMLFALGLVFNTIPFIFEWLIQPNFTVADFYTGAIEHMRFFGILQRLALTYALGMLIVSAVEQSGTYDRELYPFKAAFGLLIVYSISFHLYAPDNPFAEEHNLSRTVDYLFGANHIYLPSHDPEGLYGTLASTASFLFGFFEGRVLIGRGSSGTAGKVMVLTAAAVILLIVGELWSFVDIIAKRLWTAPFALITSGVEILLLAALIYLFDKVPRSKDFFRPLCAVGMNPLFFFLLTNITLCLLYTIPSPVEGVNLYFWLFQKTFAHLISPRFGSMIFCALWCTMWLPLAEVLYRRDIIIKI